MRKLLTHSAMAMFMSCRAKYAYRQLSAIVPIETTSALSVGTAVHRGLEIWFKTHDSNYAIESTKSEDMSPEDYAKAVEIVAEYCDQYADDSDKFKVVDVEKPFEVPLKHPDTKRRSSYWNLAGKVDAVVEINGELWIVEHKTTTSMDDDYWSRVDIDNQIKTYAVALSIDYKKPIVGCIYDVLRKPLLRMKSGETDEEFEARKAASKTGKIKQKVAETIDEFRSRLRDDLKASQFVRKYLRFNTSDLYDHAVSLWNVAKDMESVEKGKGGVYCNTSNCLGYTTCPYLNLCKCHGDLSLCADQYKSLRANAELET